MQIPWTKVDRLDRIVSTEPLQTQRACPLCHTVVSEELFALNNFQFFTDQGGLNRADHRVVNCKRCGLLYTNPCYTAEGFKILFDKAGCSYGHTAGRIDEQAEWVSCHFPLVESLMDVGCGNGNFLKALPKTLLRYGIDVDEKTLNKVAQGAPGIRFDVCDFSGLKDLPLVDVITMFHVLEHLPEPDIFLAQLRKLSKNSVSLVIEVPIVDRAATLQDRDVVGFFTVQHLTHFSKATLKKLLAKSGWSVVRSEAMADYNGWRVVAEHGPIAEEIGRDTTGLIAARRYLNVWWGNVEAVKHRLKGLEMAPNIMVWGAGQHTEYLFSLTTLFDADARFVVVDSDPLKQGLFYHSLPVLSPAQIPEKMWRNDDFQIVISTYGGQDSLLEILLEKGVFDSRIVTLYDRTARY